jgi:hypothetical protein
VKRSTHKILTTHVGSLPDPAGLDRNAPDYPQRLRAGSRQWCSGSATSASM